jgi:UPF0755 protein
MQFVERNKKIIIRISLAVALVFLPAYFFVKTGPAVFVSAGAKTFQINSGDGFREIADRLAAEGIVKSATAFKILAILSGEAGKLKPGNYELNPAASSAEILSELVSGSRREVVVTILEGSSVYEIDKILSDVTVIKAGELTSVVLSKDINGELFPDTYKFFTNSGVDETINKFLENFNTKVGMLLQKGNSTDVKRVLTMASLVEKEVPGFDDQRVVAGILEKRLKSGMPLQVDATICYIKRALAYPNDSDCYPLSTIDFKKDSPYNTYLHGGMPPGPIGNPGISAINAALNPKDSPYWYYLSDPKTKKTIFAKTFEEQAKNKAKYLGT